MQEQEIGEEIESNHAKSIRAFREKRGIFLLLSTRTMPHMRDTKDISGARRLCVTFARKRERKKRRKITFFPGPSNVT